MAASDSDAGIDEKMGVVFLSMAASDSDASIDEKAGDIPLSVHIDVDVVNPAEMPAV